MAKLQIFLPDAGQIHHDLSEEKITVGRLADNTLQIEDASVSSHHAEIIHEGDQSYRLCDLNSTNGTFVNGKQVRDVVLRHGDHVRFGAVEALFHSDAESQEQELPTSTSVVVETAKTSARPETFASSSPLPRDGQKNDPLATFLIIAASIGMLMFVVAVFIILRISAPV